MIGKPNRGTRSEFPSSRDRWRKINQPLEEKIMKNRFDFGPRGKRGGTANDVKRGSLRRGSLIEEGISLCAKQASRIGVEGDRSRPKIGGSCPIDVYFRPRALGILSNSSSGHERNERSGRREKRRKQERKEGRKDVGRTKGRNAWKIDRFEKNRDRSFVDE